MEDISFTSKVKEEIVTNKYESKERLRALFSAFIRVNGSLTLKNGKYGISLESYNAKIAKFIFTNIKEHFGVKAKMEYIKRENLKKGVFYHITIDDIGEEILEHLGISFLDGKISKDIVSNDESIAGYLAGVFLACGNVSDPKSSKYHLELSLEGESYAKWVARLFGKYKNTNIDPHICKRRNKHVVYVKKSDKISDFLLMIGAINCCLDFESKRVDRDFMNSSNRLTNLDIANMAKTAKTSEEQIKYINIIKEKIGFSNLANKKIKYLCKLRLENETASLNELAELLSAKIGENITRSNIQHLFRTIKKLAMDLK